MIENFTANKRIKRLAIALHQHGKMDDYIEKGFADLMVKVNRAVKSSIDNLTEFYGSLGSYMYIHLVELSDLIRVSVDNNTRVIDVVEKHSYVKEDGLRLVVDLGANIIVPGRDEFKHEMWSHLVVINCDGHAIGWHSTEAIDLSYLKIEPHQVSMLLHDVLLDIAVVRSWPSLYKAVVANRNPGEFNALKWNWARSKGLDCPYAKLIGSQPTYVSFAALCRTEVPGKVVFTREDCERYDRIWHDFILPLAIGAVDAEEKSLMDFRIQPIKQLLLNFPKIYGQIPQIQLKKKLDSLKPGKYILLISRRRPNEILVRKNVASWLTGREDVNWKQNRLAIFPIDEFERINWLLSYCDCTLLIV